MVTQSTLTLLYDYHYWMTRQMLAACEALTPQQWDQALGHSWGSVHGVTAHMLAAEMIWLARWNGASPAALATAEDFPTLADVRRVWANVEADLRRFVSQCDDAQLAADLHYTNTRGEPFSVPLGALMLHVANHGTHHRGELVAMLTLLGIPHPQDDLLWYVLEKQKSAA